jgi:hypothetical protein
VSQSPAWPVLVVAPPVLDVVGDEAQLAAAAQSAAAARQLRVAASSCGHSAAQSMAELQADARWVQT